MLPLRSISNFIIGRFCCYGIELDISSRYNQQHERQAAYYPIVYPHANMGVEIAHQVHHL